MTLSERRVQALEAPIDASHRGTRCTICGNATVTSWAGKHALSNCD